MSLAQVAAANRILNRVNTFAEELDLELRTIHDGLVEIGTPLAVTMADRLLQRAGPLTRAIIIESATAAQNVAAK
jgi:hypothetical protein